jgi:hypothetical protein
MIWKDQIQPIQPPNQGEKMLTNRLFNTFVILALAALMVFTIREAIASTSIAKADRSYDQAEQARTMRSSVIIQADRSYDAIETQRLGKSLTSVDRSYDQIEDLRALRTIQP